MPIKNFVQRHHWTKKYDWEHENVVIRSSAKDYRPSIQAAVKNIESIRSHVR
jgi:hypothetical protein